MAGNDDEEDEDEEDEEEEVALVESPMSRMRRTASDLASPNVKSAADADVDEDDEVTAAEAERA
jgi:hypothetical protein